MKGTVVHAYIPEIRIKIFIVPVLWILIRSDPDLTFDIKICISIASLYFKSVPSVLMTWDVGSGIKRSGSYIEFYIKRVIMVPVTWRSRPVGADLNFLSLLQSLLKH